MPKQSTGPELYEFIIDELNDIEPDLGDPEIGFGGLYTEEQPRQLCGC